MGDRRSAQARGGARGSRRALRVPDAPRRARGARRRARARGAPAADLRPLWAPVVRVLAAPAPGEPEDRRLRRPRHPFSALAEKGKKVTRGPGTRALLVEP